MRRAAAGLAGHRQGHEAHCGARPRDPDASLLMPDPRTSGGPAAPWLVADIGGTHARFGWVSSPGFTVQHEQTLRVADHAGPAEAARAFLQALPAGTAMPRRAAFAVATAVSGDEVAFTNSRWRFSREAVRQNLALERLAVVNDFEALALSLPQLTAKQLRGHQPLGAPLGPDVPVGTMLAVVGPGTGLGVGAVLKTRAGWQAVPGEGGHATLAGVNDEETQVLAWARKQVSHVSAERLLSGTGLPLLHAARSAVAGEPAPAQDLTARGLLEAADPAAPGGVDPRAAATLDLFCALLGSMAGNVALTLGSRAGLYIGGGLVPRMADRFFASAFRERFEAKGRLRTYLSAVPTALIVDTRTALEGAVQVLLHD
jgi:glucokinase